jgi:hypothetical protein
MFLYALFKVDLRIHCDCTVECVDHRQLNTIRDQGLSFSSHLTTASINLVSINLLENRSNKL